MKLKLKLKMRNQKFNHLSRAHSDTFPFHLYTKAIDFTAQIMAAEAAAAAGAALIIHQCYLEGKRSFAKRRKRKEEEDSDNQRTIKPTCLPNQQHIRVPSKSKNKS